MPDDEKTAGYRLEINLDRGPDAERVAMTLIRTARSFQYVDTLQHHRPVTIKTQIKGPADTTAALREIEAMRGKVTLAGGLLIPQACTFVIHGPLPT